MPGRLTGQTAIVTGGGRGIGRSVAHLLGVEGANVVVNDFGVNVDGTRPSEGPAAEVATEIRDAGGQAVPNFDDVSSMQGGENMVRQALDTYGRLDIVVHVAGILRDRMVFNMSEEEWDSVIAVHLKGNFSVVKPASIIFRQQRSGKIVNFTSASGLTGNTGQANYGAAKAGIAGFTRVVARDLGRYGVTCNSISPGASTRMGATIPQSATQARQARGVQPLGGFSGGNAPRGPEQVAPMTVWLCTPAAANVNGQIFQVSGNVISLLNHPSPIRTLVTDSEVWSLDALDNLVPGQLMAGIPNPAPPAEVAQASS
jgi:NAD(P)-dependent dehydrogenase (short-subunit alcohol dehydrogenase family)